MKRLLLLFVLLSNTAIFAQPLKLKNTQGGLFSLGVRSTTSLFSDKGAAFSGIGWGGQFRIQLAKRLNTEWFLDYMRSNIQHLANRTDYHIGWSVMYYFTDKVAPPVKPYIVAGHCFDRTQIIDNTNSSNRILKNSSAIQAGAGVHFNLSERLDITFLAQYMLHLGKDVHAHIENNQVVLERHQGTGIEGHMLLTLGMNYKIADLWSGNKKKKK